MDLGQCGSSGPVLSFYLQRWLSYVHLQPMWAKRSKNTISGFPLQNSRSLWRLKGAETVDFSIHGFLVTTGSQRMDHSWLLRPHLHLLHSPDFIISSSPKSTVIVLLPLPSPQFSPHSCHAATLCLAALLEPKISGHTCAYPLIFWLEYTWTWWLPSKRDWQITFSGEQGTQ